MNGEHLLEAMGLLDDDLIAQAEEPVRAGPPRRSAGGGPPWPPVWRWCWLWAWERISMETGGSTSTSSGAPTVEPGERQPSSGDSAPDMEASPGEPGAAGDSSTNSSREVLIVVVQAGDRVWSYQHWYGEDRVLDALPEGCRSLGRVGAYAEGEDCVYTDMGQFPDAPLWIAGEDMEGPVYLELPQGGYLECRGVKTTTKWGFPPGQYNCIAPAALHGENLGAVTNGGAGSCCG